MNTNYDITKDPYFKDYLTNNPRISENTIKRYQKAIFKFSIALDLTLEEIVTTCKDEQDIETEEIINVAEDENGNKITKRRVTRFDVDGKDSTIKNYFTQYEKYCKQRGNKNSTINSEVEAIRTVLMGCGVRLPKLRELEDDSDDWNLLTKEDLNYTLQDATSVHLALAHFLVGSGMRIGDALKLSIGDFMESTKEYHDFIDVEDFIDNAPADMIGTYIFHPTKTQRYGIKCITFNSAESSNLILQNLRWLKNEYYPAKSEKIGEELKISKKDALFGSKKAKYKTAMTAKAISEQWGKKNKKLREWKINQIKQKINNGELSKEDYDKEVEKIPRFHAHACRKYFQSTISRNCGDLRICALMEGHKPPLKTDKSYIKKSTKDIKEIYLKAHDDLCLSKTDTRIISDKETERLNAEIKSLRAENAKKDQKINDITQKYEEEIEKLQQSNTTITTEIADIRSQIDNVGLQTQMVDLQRRAAEHPLVQETPGLIEYVMTIFKDNINFDERSYYSDAEIDDMVILALATKNRIEKLENMVTEDSLKEEYPDYYKEVTEEITSYKERYIQEDIGVELSPLQNKKLDKALLKYKEQILSKKTKNTDVIDIVVDPNKVEEIIDKALGLFDSVEAIYDEGGSVDILPKYQ